MSSSWTFQFGSKGIFEPSSAAFGATQVARPSNREHGYGEHGNNVMTCHCTQLIDKASL